MSGLQELIDATAEKGGGMIRLEPRNYHCGMLKLRAGVHLHLPEGCVLEASPDPADFPVLGSTYNETGEIRAFLFAEGVRDISLTGSGTIRGTGTSPLEASRSEGLGTRPETVFFRDCANIRIEGLTIRDSSFWTVHLLRCETVAILRTTIRNRLDRINTDGIDPDGCRDVAIRDCDIESGDDCIVIKSTEGDPVDTITVSGCRLRTPCAALKIGTETYGDMSRLRISDCQIRESGMAFGIFLKDGGTIRDVLVENLEIDCQGEFPLFIDHTPRFEGESKEGRLQEVTLRDIAISSPGRLFVQGGYQTSLEGLVLERIHWHIPFSMDLTKAGKPSGSLRGRRPPRTLLPEREPYQICLANIENLRCADCRFESRDGRLPEGRGLLYAESASGRFTRFDHPKIPETWKEPVKRLRSQELTGI